jgi:ABC-type uncharacterized transport system fused permease/ATPase subunit
MRNNKKSNSSTLQENQEPCIIHDVGIVYERQVVVSVAELKNLQTMCFFAQILNQTGGIFVGLIVYGIWYVVLGILLIALGIFVQHLIVKKKLSEWNSTQQRGDVFYNPKDRKTRCRYKNS